MKKIIELRIEKGTIKYLDDCKEALTNSELGRRYFTNGKGAEEAGVSGVIEVHS